MPQYVHSNTIHTSQDVEITYMSGDRWLDQKQQYLHTVECYSAIKKNEIMPSAAPRMPLEMITLSEVRKRKTNTL